MSARGRRIFSIPPGAPFLDTLADALIDGRLVGDVGWPVNPLQVADVTVYLPTRRAARAFAGALAARARGPLILPRIVPLGDADEAELKLIGDGDVADFDVGRPPAHPAERLIFLADLVMRWRKRLDIAITPLPPTEHRLIAETPHEAFALAGDLTRVLDMLTIEGVDADRLANATPGEHDVYWKAAQTFLEIATRAWQAWLDAHDLSDPVRRRDDVLRARARQIADGRAGGPMIAAGSTGTNPATAELIGAIARHPRGAVVLPGLDLTSIDDDFAAILNQDEPAASHPQAALARLLTRLNASREDVAPLGEGGDILAARERVLAQAMLPAARTPRWADARGDPDEAGRIGVAFADATIIEAESEREEAQAIALIMREAIQEPERTAALVTPDRTLAERVAAMLRRWDIEIDDSAGRALSRAPRGALAILVARWLAAPADGALIGALLSHPDISLGRPRARVERAAAAIDIGLLRGYPASHDLATLLTVLPHRRTAAQGERASRPARRLSSGDWDDAAAALSALSAIHHRYRIAAQGGVAPLADWIAGHRQALIALAGAGEDGGALFTEPDGEALRDLFDALIAGGDGRAPIDLADYPGVIKTLLDDATLSPPRRTHPRLSIWGLLEARLLGADRIILGGLNEATWPPQPSADAFLNRALRGALGLPQPERRIGQTAHDFVSAFAGARDAVLTRSRKSGGAPTIPSRFWRRLMAYAGDKDPGVIGAKTRGARWLAIARGLDAAGAARPAARPSPRPPAVLVPRRLSVTRVETLVRDPYAVFAREILQLDPLPAVGVVADAALRGTLVHEAVARFAQDMDPAAPDAVDRLVAIGEALFATSGVDRERIVFWRPAFKRAARPYIAWERARRPAIVRLEVERGGKIILNLADGGEFALTARADRVELTHDGDVALVDFKTGRMPSRSQVENGFAPQLTLEAAMAARGGFGEIYRGRSVIGLVYVRLSGARSGAFDMDAAAASKAGGSDAVDTDVTPTRHLDQLVRRMNAHLTGAIGFASHAHRDPKNRARPGDYDHLARVLEWSRGVDEDE